MALLEIKKYPDPILSKKCRPVKDFNKLEKLFQDMTETMYQNDGIGLAASQVGIDKCIFVVDIGQGPLYLVNPRIIKESNQRVSNEEGCLSLPGINFNIKRAKWIELEAYLLNKNEQVKLRADDLLARVFQHEIDHLNGVLIIDRVSFWQKIKVLRKLKRRE
ncbi:peptide deformylase [Patescibacteria group bacterium]|nr:peptide deformylase [Patescibacteria group bacterium]